MKVFIQESLSVLFFLAILWVLVIVSVNVESDESNYLKPNVKERTKDETRRRETII